jgi:hypothetical protein
VERHYCTVAAELLHPEQGSLLAAEVCGWCYGVAVEASLVSGTVVAVVAAQHPRIHTASAVVEEVDHAVGEGVHVGSAAWTDQLSSLSNASCKMLTCCAPGMAPYVTGLYPPAPCCCGWCHCWFAA